MDKRINGFHTYSRRYHIQIIESTRKALSELFNEINKITKDSISYYENKEVMNLFEEFNNKNLYCLIKSDISQAILNKIEAISPEKFESLQEIKETIISLCEEAKIDERKHYSDVSEELKTEICNKEKIKFINHINSIDEDELENIEPLFYRRVLSIEKIKEIKEKINEIWYESMFNEKDFTYYDKSEFQEKVKLENLLSILKEKAVDKVYEINTGGINSVSYIMELSALNLYYTDGCDIYWCSDEMDWMIEESHEGFYIIYGDWLKAEIKKFIQI